MTQFSDEYKKAKAEVMKIEDTEDLIPVLMHVLAMEGALGIAKRMGDIHDERYIQLKAEVADMKSYVCKRIGLNPNEIGCIAVPKDKVPEDYIRKQVEKDIESREKATVPHEPMGGPDTPPSGWPLKDKE